MSVKHQDLIQIKGQEKETMFAKKCSWTVRQDVAEKKGPKWHLEAIELLLSSFSAIMQFIQVTSKGLARHSVR